MTPPIATVHVNHRKGYGRDKEYEKIELCFLLTMINQLNQFWNVVAESESEVVAHEVKAPAQGCGRCLKALSGAEMYAASMQ